jgi:hypothetical protein
MASLSHVTAMFNHPVLTTLTDVNFNSLTILQRELNANASSIITVRSVFTIAEKHIGYQQRKTLM